MKLIRVKNNLSVIFSDGVMMTSSICTDEMYEDIVTNQENEDFVKSLLKPNLQKVLQDYECKKELMSNLKNSEFLTVKGSSIYLTSVSEVSLPEDLAIAIWEAEKSKNVDLLSSYLNFWTLCSLNPDSRARTNLFWFLNRYGMSISSSGLFVAYRNVVLKSKGNVESKEWVEFITKSFEHIKFKRKKSPKKFYLGKDEQGEYKCADSKEKLATVSGVLDDLYRGLSDSEVAPVYTDGYSRTFNIRIGEPVTMDREKCDPNQDNTCSKGLHVAGKSWLQSNYFGDTGLRVLVNPADVVAVPPQDSYGKMRTCAYYPISVVSFDASGKILAEDINNGFEDNFIDMITYTGKINNEDKDAYKMNIPSIPEINKSDITNRFKDIKAILAIKQEPDELD